MDHVLFMDRDYADDIERCRIMNEDASSAPSSSAKQENPFPANVSAGLASLDFSVKEENGENLGSNTKYCNEICLEDVQVLIEIDNNEGEVVATDLGEKKTDKEKRKSLSAKKPPKPPRPPRGLSLDAADQKLIKELTGLAMIKRAKIERIKALKKMKAAKVSSSPSSSSGSLFAMLCTVIFCVVIICQGMSSRNNAAVSFHSSQVSAGARDNSFIVVEDHTSLSASETNSKHSGPPELAEHVSDLDTLYVRKRATG